MKITYISDFKEANKMKKHLFVLSLTLSAVLLSSSFAFAATPQEAADQLNAKGLFEGTAKGYELDRQMTRAEAVTMFVKILGKNEEAKSKTWNTPFTDVEDWAKPYVGYAYNNGLTSGVSATQFGSNEAVSYSQYLTFVLKALDYEVGKDFQWDKAYELSNQIGLTSGVGSNSRFLRGDAAVVSLGAVERMSEDMEKPNNGLYPNSNTNTSGTILVPDKVGRLYVYKEGNESYKNSDYSKADKVYEEGFVTVKGRSYYLFEILLINTENNELKSQVKIAYDRCTKYTYNGNIYVQVAEFGNMLGDYVSHESNPVFLFE